MLRISIPGGSSDGRPSFEQFEDQPEAVEGTAIRFAVTHQLPVFPAMVMFGCLGTDDSVELLDVIVDEDYFSRPENAFNPASMSGSHWS